MGAPSHTPEATTDNGVESAPPDWDCVPFPVGCARCGHDLRDLTEPICPACGLEFDWADAVPIERLTCLHCGYHLYGLREKRCPECGESFTWEEVLAEYHRRRKPLFEYRWREQPVRSLVGTWFRALRPGKFWRTIDIHDPPQIWPLMCAGTIAVVLVTLLSPILEGLQWWMRQRSTGFTRLGRPPPGWSDLPMYIIHAISSPYSYAFPLLAILWSAPSFAALMIFRQSMRLCKVLAVHVLRVWAYSLPHMLPTWFLAVCAARLTEALLGLRPFDLANWVLLAFPGFVTWSLRQGYRHYLHMAHSLGVAIASQIIAWLAAAVVFQGIAWVLSPMLP